MRKVFSTLALAFVASSAFCQSAITLSQSNFPLPLDTVSLTDVSSLVSTNPTIGSNQTWNYTALSLASGTPAQNIYVPVSSDPNFPAANFYVGITKGLSPSLNLGYLANQYYEINSTGASAVGLHIYAQNYGLGALTGNNADTLYVLDNILYFPTTPERIVAFPATASSAWSTSPTRHVVNMQLTVTASGLNKTPLQQVFYESRTDSVVGWGTLELPAMAGFNSNVPVLQDMCTQTVTDSFYLSGSPAPANLLSAFSVSQGQSSTPSYDRIYMYRAGSFTYQMLFDYTDNTFSTLSGVYINDNYPSFGAGIDELSAEKSSAYPDPMDGHSFKINVSSDIPVSAVDIRDLSGRTVDHVATANNNGIISVQTSTTLANGLYIYSVTGADGATIAKGKINSVK